MNKSQFPLLIEKDLDVLQDRLHYMKMPELKKACEMLRLSPSGKKAELVKRIMSFIKTGEIVYSPTIPVKACVQYYPRQPLAAQSLMLYGGYKNDAQARALFKKLIGSHFHFTAFGIDWLNKRWQEGKPPTYQEFADYWVEEKACCTRNKPEPKEEWAYIRFLQNMNKVRPHATKEYLMHEWKLLQAQQAENARKLLNKVIEKL